MSLYLLDRERYTPKPAASEFPSKNPYKRKKKLKDEHLVPLDVRQKYAEDIADFAVHDAENSSILSEFELVQMNTECIFSKKAVLWGATEYEPSLTLGTLAIINITWQFITVLFLNRAKCSQVRLAVDDIGKCLAINE